MKKNIFSALFLIAAVISITTPAAAQGIIYKVADPSGYCHLKFPAIREDTLFSNRPVLKDSRDGDIIDFYGPCDYDPLGRQEVMRQRADIVRERNRRVGEP
jgi:hypothetical protein